MKKKDDKISFYFPSVMTMLAGKKVIRRPLLVAVSLESILTLGKSICYATMLSVFLCETDSYLVCVFVVNKIEPPEFVQRP